MLGAIVGDVAGSAYEFHPWHGDWRDVPFFTPQSTFTDDTVMTLAVAQALMQNSRNQDAFRTAVVERMRSLGGQYPDAGYGARFREWLGAPAPAPYNSFGNGSAMRVSPVGWAFATLEATEDFARASADVTHSHPEGVKGACAVAGSIFLARQGKSKREIAAYVSSRYGYDLERSLEQIRTGYHFDETCPGSVPEAILAFLKSGDFAETIARAIWLCGDADTQAAIAGSIAEAFYGGVPETLAAPALSRLDGNLLRICNAWRNWLAGLPQTAAGLRSCGYLAD